MRTCVLPAQITYLSLAEHWLCLPKFWGILGVVAEDWGRLADAVKKRREELRLSQDAIRAAGGPSDMVLGRIEKNEEPHPRDDTLHKLDGPLQWESGSTVDVLNGGDPTPLSHRPLGQSRERGFESVSMETLAEIASAATAEIQRRIEDGDDKPKRRGPPPKPGAPTL